MPPEVEGLVAWRLRGMATVPELRSTGVGSAVLTAGLTAVREAGGDLVWCNGRTEAMVFYRTARVLRDRVRVPLGRR